MWKINLAAPRTTLHHEGALPSPVSKKGVFREGNGAGHLVRVQERVPAPLNPVGFLFQEGENQDAGKGERKKFIIPSTNVVSTPCLSSQPSKQTLLCQSHLIAALSNTGTKMA